MFSSELPHMEVLCKMSRALGLCGMSLTIVSTDPFLLILHVRKLRPRKTKSDFPSPSSWQQTSCCIGPTTERGTSPVLAGTHVIFFTALWRDCFHCRLIEEQAEAQPAHTAVKKLRLEPSQSDSQGYHFDN